MAAFGAKHLRFTQISEEKDGALPTYNQEKSVLLGLVKADLSVNYASGELYSDDRLSEKVEEFVSGSIAVEVDELEEEGSAVLYGSSINSDKENVDNSGDDAPYGGLAYYKTLKKNNTKFWRGYFYPKVRAAIGNDNASTKSSSITLATTPVNFTVHEPKTGDWRYRKKFSSESEAIAWVEAKLGAEAAQPPGGDTE